MMNRNCNITKNTLWYTQIQATPLLPPINWYVIHMVRCATIYYWYTSLLRFCYLFQTCDNSLCNSLYCDIDSVDRHQQITIVASFKPWTPTFHKVNMRGFTFGWRRICSVFEIDIYLYSDAIVIWNRITGRIISPKCVCIRYRYR